MASHIAEGGRLMLGTQGPHFNYEKTISNGMTYSQEIEPLKDGFIKHYFLDDGTERVMSQTIRYRTYGFEEACAMLSSVGLHYDEDASRADSGSVFIGFSKS